MTELEKFDRYTIIKAICNLSDYYMKHIAENTVYNNDKKEDLVQRNEKIFQGVIDRLLEK